MKPHTYSFKYRKASGVLLDATIEANGSTQAYNAACMDSSFEDCKILKGSFKRTDTAKGANRAGGLDSNGKQLNAKTIRQEVEAQAYKDFLKHLNLSIEALYLCNFENNGAVLSMPIKELYEAMKEYDPFK